MDFIIGIFFYLFIFDYRIRYYLQLDLLKFSSIFLFFIMLFFVSLLSLHSNLRNFSYRVRCFGISFSARKEEFASYDPLGLVRGFDLSAWF
jgi:hypothetical protein